MYPDSGYKRAHAQSVCTGPFSRVGRGLGTRLIQTAKLVSLCSLLGAFVEGTFLQSIGVLVGAPSRRIHI